MNTLAALAEQAVNNNLLGIAAGALVVGAAFVMGGAFAPFGKAGKLKLIGIGAVATAVAVVLILVA